MSNQEEKKRMHDSLRDLMDKYEEMTKLVGMLLSVDNLLNRTNCDSHRFFLGLDRL